MLQNNLAQISSYFNESILGKIITLITKNFNTELELMELNTFKNTGKDLLVQVAKRVESAIQNVKTNIAWMENNKDTVVEWLTKHTPKVRNIITIEDEKRTLADIDMEEFDDETLI